nr:uncharacterized protein LOC109179535 isoform X2 [Ipomoea batatas]
MRNTFVQGQSEKYGSWMLVSRKEKGNRFRKTNHPKEGPPMARNAVQRSPVGEGWGMQSRFAALDSLEEDDLALDQEHMEGREFQNQPIHNLPRIRTREQSNQGNPQQRGTAHKDSRQAGARQNQNVQRGGGQFVNQDGRRTFNQVGHQYAQHGGHFPANRGDYHFPNGGNRGRRGRGGAPNRAATESEHTVVRGSESGRKISSTVVYHEHEQADFTTQVGFGTSPKDDPPDRGARRHLAAARKAGIGLLRGLPTRRPPRQPSRPPTQIGSHSPNRSRHTKRRLARRWPCQLVASASLPPQDDHLRPSPPLLPADCYQAGARRSLMSQLKS